MPSVSGSGTERVERFDIAVVPHEAPELCPHCQHAHVTLDPMSEDDEGNNGNSVTELLERGGFEAGDGSPHQGIAVTRADNTHGVWQYSIDNGGEWRDLSLPGQIVDMSETSRLLPADGPHRIRFLPHPLDADEIMATLMFRAWDMSTGIAGGTADTTESGGRTAFSADVGEAEVTVLAKVGYVSVTITGRVTDDGGNPMSGVIVSIRGKGDHRA